MTHSFARRLRSLWVGGGIAVAAAVAFTPAWSQVADVAAPASDAAKSAAQPATDATKSATKAASDTASGAAKDATKAASDTTRDASKATRDATRSVREAGSDATREARDAVRDTAKGARDTAQDAREGVRDTAKGARETVRDAGRETRDTVRDAREGTRDAVRDTREGARDAVRDVREEGRDTAREARDTVRETREGARDTVGEARDTARDTTRDAREGTRDARETVRDARGETRDAVRDTRDGELRDSLREGVRDTAREFRDEVRGTVRDVRGEVRDRIRGSVSTSSSFHAEDIRPADIGIWFDRSSTNGLVISDIGTTGAIARVGFREGDRIVSVNGHKVTRQDDFIYYLFAPSIRHERVKVVVWRDNAEEIVYVEPHVFVEQYTSVHHDPMEHFGIVLDDRYDDRLIVWKVLPRTPAFYAGIRAGDVITTFDGQQITSPDQFVRMVGKVDAGSVDIAVNRNQATRKLQVELDEDFQGEARTTLKPNLDDDNATPRLDRRENRLEGRQERREDRRDVPRLNDNPAAPGAPARATPPAVTPPTATPPTVAPPAVTPPVAAPAATPPRAAPGRPGILPRNR